ncbi:MAG: Rdx family protein [Nitrososphaerota archaeon]|jgi:predicted Rdx family selenoprotein|nr:Rdx family protein [Nitrososphaerota archaeon]
MVAKSSLTEKSEPVEYALDFCVSCYLPDALPVIQGLLERHAHDEAFHLVLTPGPAGSFEVKQGGKVVYSKAKSGRLPTLSDLGLPDSDTPSSSAKRKSCC